MANTNAMHAKQRESLAGQHSAKQQHEKHQSKKNNRKNAQSVATITTVSSVDIYLFGLTLVRI